MASGLLGKVAITSASTWTQLYQVPASKVATFNISVCNKSTASLKIRIALCVTTTPGTDEQIEYDTTIDANSSFERTGIVLDATKYVMVFSDTAGSQVVFMAWGYEE